MIKFKYFDQELMSNFKNYNKNLDYFYEIPQNYNNNNQNFTKDFISKHNIYKENSEKEIAERLRLDEEIRGHNKHLEMLRQEEIIKKKRYQDSLLSQINEKIQRQKQMLNNKYSNSSVNPENESI